MSFGWSVGDLVTAIQILVQVGQALKDAGGAADEYREDSLFLVSLATTLEKLRQKPDSLKDVKDQVDGIYEGVKKLETKLRDRFSDSLDEQKSQQRNKWKALLCTAPRKIEYAFLVSREVRSLRDRCSGPLQTIQLSLQLDSLTALSSVDESLRDLPPQLIRDFRDTIDLNLKTFHEVLEKRDATGLAEKVLTWLQPVPTEDKYTDTLHRLLPGSCEWLLTKPQMVEFLASKSSSPKWSLFWVTGIPGAGKTNLATWCIHRLGASRRVGYFYCEVQREETTENSVNILRTWVWQILRQDLSQVDAVAVSYRQGERPNRVNMKASLQKILQGQPRPLLILDGLDECESAVRCTFYADLETINQYADVIIFSREMSDMSEWVRKVGSKVNVFRLHISEEDTILDMDSFIKQAVATLDLDNDDEAEALSSVLRTGAKGMFIWVDVMVKYLKMRLFYFAESLADYLNDLPMELGDLYGRIMARLADNRDSSDMSKLLLTWIACARRPLTLNEIGAAYTVKIGQATKPRALPLTDSSRMRLEQALKRCCGPLIKLYKDISGVQTVSLVHASAKDFLLEHATTPDDAPYRKLLISATDGHRLLGEACLTYLCYDDLDFVPFKDAKIPTSIQWDKQTYERLRCIADHHFSQYPLLEYAALNWWEHLASTEGYLNDSTAFERLYASARHTVRWLQLYLCCRGQLDFTLANQYMGDRFGIKSLTDRLNGDRKSKYQAWYDHLDPAGPIRFSRWEQFLCAGHANHLLPETHIAAFFDFADLVQDLVLNRGISPNSKTYVSQTPLFLAARGEAVNSARVLIQAGADINAIGWEGSTPLLTAVGITYYNARSGPFNVAALLLASGAVDVTVRMMEGWHTEQTALHKLCALPEDNYVVHTVEELFKHGAAKCINEMPPHTHSPLHIAARRGSRRLVNLLLQNGADVEIGKCHKDASTPLVWTCGRHNPDIHVIKSLLDHGASVHATRASDGRTPLHLSSHSDASLARLLLDHKADVNASSHDKSLPIHDATFCNNHEVVQLLIANGAFLDRQDHTNRTPLDIAMDNNYKQIAITLIQSSGIAGTDRWTVSHTDSGIRISPRKHTVYPQGLDDQLNVFRLLRSLTSPPLPNALLSAILDYAEYWAPSTVTRTESIQLDEKASNKEPPYLVSKPIQNPQALRAVKFTIRSHDQGWSDYVEHHGTYEGSCTGFHVHIVRADGSKYEFGEGDSDKIVNNIHASMQTREHVVLFGGSVGRRCLWISRLRAGDRIALVARAKYPGWVNYVESARIDLYRALMVD